MANNSGASSASSSMNFLLIEDIDFVQVDEQGLSHWELVNASDADADSEKEEEQEQEEEGIEDSIGNEIGSLGSEISTPGYLNDAQIETHHVDVLDFDGDVKYDYGYYGYGDGDGGHGEEQYDEDDEDDDNGDDGRDLDDELVPWAVSDKVGRQRMRKLGKRVFSKMNTSKRSPYLFVRPGCVRGKHGLGMKHKC
ncbi:uncharacterized protein LOC132179685 [Corylus avellana]|uniref:uncharacterized protein LOC132179685 n=1 Tax=Corylus avellana TaxID=13451 RepID=UPI001E2395B4|nr:uncharacterized protein LOC132179685 [Corylus avellana]